MGGKWNRWRLQESIHRREKLFGEFLLNAQGEDVVAGIRTPEENNH